MTHLEEHSLPYMDKALPDAWKAATTFASAISKETTQHGAVIRGRRDHQDGVFPKKWRRDLCREFVDVSES